jgi:hypothetical protein
LRESWEHLNWHPNTQIDFYQLVNQTSDGSTRPIVFAFERRATVSGLIVGRLSQRSLQCKVGYRAFGLGKVRQLTILHGGVLGCADVQMAESMFHELMLLLKRNEVDVVFFNHVSTDSPLYALIKSSPGFLCRDHLIKPQLHWKASLPANGNEFIQRLSKKRRYWVRRADKLLREAFPGQVSFRCVGSEWSLEKLLPDVETVAASTYQRGLGAGFSNTSEGLRRLAYQAERRWLRLCLLYVGDRPCAFWMGRVYKNVFYSDATGYDRAFSKFEVGTAVFLRTIENLCDEGVQEFDFGLGDAFYKERFGDESWSESEVWIYAPSLRCRLLNVIRTAIEWPVLRIRSLLVRARLEQRLKTFWRSKLAKKVE